jgi:CHAD domain-containing protein
MGRGTPLRTVIKASLDANVVRLLQHDALMRVRDEPEDVHQARVATRRFRSDVRTFRRVVDPGWRAGIRDDVRWLADHLGRVRDADVLVARLSRASKLVATDDREAAKELMATLRTERDVERRALLDVLESTRYRSLIGRLADAAAIPPVTVEAEARAADALPAIVAAPQKHLANAIAALGEEPADSDLHEVRIRAKRARYAAEAAAPVCGKPAKRMGRALAALQEVLGQLQDSVVAEQWLRHAASGGPPAWALVAGQLVAREQIAQAEARAAWQPLAQRVLRPKLSSWLA